MQTCVIVDDFITALASVENWVTGSGLVNGKLNLNGAVTDSRLAKTGTVFFARKGENSDGHHYIKLAYEAGSRVFVVEKDWYSKLLQDNELRAYLAEGSFFCVSDSTKAYGCLAKWWRQQLSCPVILITGSVGKTTTKEILGQILSGVVGKGTFNKQSYNNHIGLPQTILGADSNDKWLVLEAGMNHAGELAYLASIANPDVVVILNVAPVHLEFFNSLSEIADAKCEVLPFIREGGTLIVNGENKVLLDAVERAKALSPGFTQLTLGRSNNTSICFQNVKDLNGAGISFELSLSGKKGKVKSDFIGEHLALNITVAIAAANAGVQGLDLGELCLAVSAKPKVPMRFEVKEIGGFTLINDCYNASPMSMRAALCSTSKMAGGTGFTAVLGDMLELGDISLEAHREIGQFVGQQDCHRLIAIGKMAEAMVSGAKDAGLSDAIPLKTIEGGISEIVRDPQSRIVLFKASRELRLERLVEQLKLYISNH